MEGVHQLQLDPQVLLGEVVQHTGVDQALHEGRPVLTETQRGKPVVPNPLMVHVSICQGGSAKHLGSVLTMFQLLLDPQLPKARYIKITDVGKLAEGDFYSFYHLILQEPACSRCRG